MDERTLRRATEPFFTTKGVGKGTGLGLSMVHGLAEQSGGTLILKSKPGVGTTAELWLPAADTASIKALPAAAPMPEPVNDQFIGPLSVLVVDDDPLVLSNTGAMLEDLGHSVTTAASADAALRGTQDATLRSPSNGSRHAAHDWRSADPRDRERLSRHGRDYRDWIRGAPRRRQHDHAVAQAVFAGRSRRGAGAEPPKYLADQRKKQLGALPIVALARNRTSAAPVRAAPRDNPPGVRRFRSFFPSYAACPRQRGP